MIKEKILPGGDKKINRKVSKGSFFKVASKDNCVPKGLK